MIRTLLPLHVFPDSFLACPFISFAVSAPFISLKTPLFALLSLFVPAVPCTFLHLGVSPAPSSFSCSSFDLHVVHLQSLLVPCISHSAPCFALPACIASSASSGRMLAMLAALSSIRHPQKTLVFGRCGDMLQKSPKPIRKSFASYKSGPSAKRTHGPRMVGGMGRTALYLKVSPAGLACGPRPVAGFTR